MKILPFDYSNSQPDDGFNALAELMVAHRSFVFATPVYWYAMSGLMKNSFDRLSDLLSDRDPKRRNRSLAGADVWLLSIGTDSPLPAGFEELFRMTSRYLDMCWRDGFYVRSGEAPDMTPVSALAQALRASASPVP
jgi:putative NADPH-quinone reductase